MYRYTIRSIFDMHPTLAENEDVFSNGILQGVNEPKEIGSPIDPLAAQDSDSISTLGV